jgi:hypothetical protein
VKRQLGRVNAKKKKKKKERKKKKKKTVMPIAKSKQN